MNHLLSFRSVSILLTTLAVGVLVPACSSDSSSRSSSSGTSGGGGTSGTSVGGVPCGAPRLGLGTVVDGCVPSPRRRRERPLPHRSIGVRVSRLPRDRAALVVERRADARRPRHREHAPEGGERAPPAHARGVD